MTKKSKMIIYYLFLVVMFIFIDKIINMMPKEKFNDYYLIKEENNRLKKDIVYLSKINNKDNYELCNISINNLYSSNTYFVNCSFKTNNNIVLNDLGFIGLVNNNIITLTKDLTLSVIVNNNKGILKDNKINIVHSDYNKGDKVYVSYLNEEYLIGYVDNIINNGSSDNILLKYIDINSSYVVVLK